MSSRRAKRVAFIAPSGRRPKTGGERHLLQWLQHLDPARVQPLLICRRGPLLEAAAQCGIPCAELPCLRTLKRHHWLRYAALAPGLLRLAENSTDRASPPAEGPRPWAARLDQLGALFYETPAPQSGPQGRLLGEQLARELRLDVVDKQLIGLHALRLRLLKERHGIEIFVADLPWDAAACGLAASATTRVWWFLHSSSSPGPGEGLAKKLSHRIVACGSDVATARLGSINRAEIVANGIDLERFRPKSSKEPRPARLAQLPDDARFIGTAGALSAQKGTDTLLQACTPLLQANRQRYLLLMGEGSTRFCRRLRKEAEKAGIANQVLWLGYLDDLPAYLRQLTIFALPSHTEGLPLALCEALASGVASLASDIPGCQEVARGGGVELVNARKRKSWRLALQALIDDPARRATLARAGRSNAERHYDRTRMLRQLNQLFEVA